MSLVVLSFFRDEAKAVQLANLVKSAGGILGAAVCCAENGGDPNDDWTTCDRDRDVLLDRYAQMLDWSNLRSSQADTQETSTGRHGVITPNTLAPARL